RRERQARRQPDVSARTTRKVAQGEGWQNSKPHSKRSGSVVTSWQDRGWLGSLCRFARASARWQLLLVDAGERIPEAVRQGRGTHAAATHGGRALTLVGKRDAESGNVTFNVGPSDTHI